MKPLSDDERSQKIISFLDMTSKKLKNPEFRKWVICLVVLRRNLEAYEAEEVGFDSYAYDLDNVLSVVKDTEDFKSDEIRGIFIRRAFEVRKLKRNRDLAKWVIDTMRVGVKIVKRSRPDLRATRDATSSGDSVFDLVAKTLRNYGILVTPNQVEKKSKYTSKERPSKSVFLWKQTSDSWDLFTTSGDS